MGGFRLICSSSEEEQPPISCVYFYFVFVIFMIKYYIFGYTRSMFKLHLHLYYNELYTFAFNKKSAFWGLVEFFKILFYENNWNSLK